MAARPTWPSGGLPWPIKPATQPASIAVAWAAQGGVFVDIFAAAGARPLLEKALSLAESLASQPLATLAARYAALALLDLGLPANDIHALLDRAERVPSAAAPEAVSGQTLPERAITCARAQVALAGGDAVRALALVTE